MFVLFKKKKKEQHCDYFEIPEKSADLMTFEGLSLPIDPHILSTSIIISLVGNETLQQL